MKERLMKAIPGVLAVLCTLSTTTALSQGGPPPASATDVTNVEVQAEAKKAQGAALSDRLVSVADMGQYNVAVAVVTRAASDTPSGAFSHLKITEVYYILRGSGTQVTGTLVNGTGGGPDPLIGPTLGGRSPLQNARSSKLGPGDIQIIPPGVAHAWSSIDAGGIDYLVYRIDPDHLLALPKK
jgi:mannose-6-phosphate isomerase-like protein (cupin superfamily)